MSSDRVKLLDGFGAKSAGNSMTSIVRSLIRGFDSPSPILACLGAAHLSAVLDQTC
jgi:hypothetical protein